MKRIHLILTVASSAALVLPIAADRVTAAVVEHRVADRLRCAAGLSRAPDVTLAGIPALTQVLDGRLAELRVTAAGVPVHKLTVDRVTAVARNVRLPGTGGVEVGTATVDATLAYATIPATALGAGGAGAGVGTGNRTGAGGTVRITGADSASRLMIATTLPVHGLALPVTVHADLALDGDRLALTPAQVELPGLGVRLPAARLPAAARQTRSVALPALPGGLTYRSVRATKDGLEMTAAGSGLRMQPAGHAAGRAPCGTNPA